MTIAFVALGLAALVVVLILLVLIGAHREAPWTALDAEPPTRLAGFARAVLGVHVQKNGETTRTAPLVNGRR
ncbi:hypothetical protein [Actinomadura sp. DC4]|uniref:hypothetical protein n=1 Tax=Actinomadura sp. DC4 TaxID=3055069 RepID=UPI0025B06E12|nr:hypothetical protein [Actinomadura sp. DC4]MDN3355851.1 hypothetical protein [Actinomadura sp. DC4]